MLASPRQPIGIRRTDISSERVFVAVPTYNRPGLLPETVESVRAQTFRDFRLVIGDDGSADELRTVVKEMVDSLDDQRVQLVLAEKNGGEYGIGRLLFDAAKDHEFFMILHDDDLLEPEYLAEAVATLDRERDVDVFVADPTVVNISGVPSALETDHYLRYHGRNKAPRGVYSVLERHYACGFTPISATLFRTSALLKSGFVDADLSGNFPFEFNIFTRLGEQGAQGWYDPQRLHRVRFHDNTMRTANGARGVFGNERVVATTIKLIERRTFTGFVERRRKAILAGLKRAQAMHVLKRGDYGEARQLTRTAVELNPVSVRNWLYYFSAHLRIPLSL